MQNAKLVTLDNVIHFGLDHLEIYGSYKIEETLFEELEFIHLRGENKLEIDSHKVKYEGKLEGYTFTKLKVNRYKYKIIFKKGDYALFDYYKAEVITNSIIKSKNKVVVHGMGFKHLNYDEILYFLETYFKLDKCVRFDICIDLNVEIDKILETFSELRTGRNYIKNFKTETRYIGEKNKNKNKRHVIRIYDKIYNIRQNNNNKLYKNYLVEDYVTRIELEVRSELAKNVSPLEIFDNILLTGIFKNYLKKHTDIFEILDTKNITLYKKSDKKISEDIYQSTVYKDKKFSIALGHMRSIYENGYCPTRLCIGAGLYMKNTENYLNQYYLGSLEDMENELKINEFLKIYIRRKKEEEEKLKSNLKNNG